MAFDFGSAIESTNAIDQLFKLNKSMKVLTAAIFGFSKSADKKFLNIRGRKDAANAINSGKVDLKVEKENAKIQQDIVDKLNNIIDKMDKAGILDSEYSTLASKIILFNDDQLKNAQGTLVFFEMMSDWIEKKSERTAAGFSNLINVLINAAERVGSKQKQFETMNEALRGIGEMAQSLSAMSGALVKLALGIAFFGLVIVGFAAIVGAGGVAMTVLSILIIAAAIRVLSMFSNPDGKKSAIQGIGMDLAFLGLAVIGLSLAGLIFQNVGWQGFLMTGLTLIFLGLAIRISNMTAGDRGGDDNGLARSILALAIGVLILTISSMLFGKVGVKPLIMMATVLAALALAIGVSSRLSKGHGDNLGASILWIAVSVAIFALSVWIWNRLVPDYESAIAPGIALMFLAGVFFLISKRGDGILKAAIGLVVATVAIMLLAFAIKMYENITYETMLKPGLAVAGLTAALYILGSRGASSILAAAALVVAAVALVIMAKAMQMSANVEAGTFLGMGLFALGLAGVLILLGAMPMSILGAGALVAGALAIIMIAKGLQMAKGVTGLFLPVAAGILGLAGTFILIGNPFTLFFLLAGVAGALGIAATVYTIASGLEKLKKAGITKSDAKNAADIVGAIIDTLSDVFDRNSGKMWSVFLGTIAVARLGNVIATIAQGVAMMANLTVTEYAVKGDKIVPVSVRKLNETDFRNAGIGISRIVNAVTDPLAKIGEKTQGSWFFSNNPVKAGIDAISGLGNLMSSLAKGVQDMANLTFTQYAVKNDKIVPVSRRALTEADFTAVGKNLNKIIYAVTGPLERIGSKAGFFTDSPVGEGIDQIKDLGNLIVDIAKGVQDMADLKFVKYKIVKGELVPDRVVHLSDRHFKQVGINFGKVINALKGPLEKIGGDTGFFSDSDVKEGIDQLKDIGDIIDPVVNLVKTFSEMKFDGKPEEAGLIVGTILKNVSRSLAEAKKLKFETKPLLKVNYLMAKMNKNVEKFDHIAESFEKMARSIEKLNKQLSNDRFKRIMETTKAIESMAKGNLNKNFQRLLELVADKMAHAVSAIERAIKASGSINVIDRPLPVTGVSKVLPDQKSKTGGPSKTSIAAADLQIMESYLELILQELKTGTLDVNVRNSSY